MKSISVHDLRRLGFKVRVKHMREKQVLPHIVGDVLDLTQEVFCPKGGSTIVEVRTPDGEELRGEARCSDKDAYNRKLGVRIALGRALSKVGVHVNE